MRLLFLIVLFGYSFAMYACNEERQREIQLRIQPVGEVSVQGQAQAELGNKTPGDAGAKNEPGKDTYEHYCIVCHREGLAGAPKFRDEHDWKPRLSERKLDELLASSIKGLNAMPVKGTCIKCSDEDLKAAISYMLPKS
ncbi:c-type cytochrome [Fluoribacter dumoffii]|uniref:c-type cytochrome n=1 Tax=Fluoribacter dumoffii TaxID=463 RepID=UPI002242E94A|nr:c-type cytochrome [Fluoribacter dumoffii]MCW8417372.1 c-type cytochrome [Fluoribacter dumoffii]MCW8454787.1 c-type cytochrome [Fluoribacter dumoffii]MCW8461136.1 c-type cytochrome [Fluoribacter dumoffii]MCW8484577.1 c-type cytochrome [Fluoribacter dumoffii]